MASRDLLAEARPSVTVTKQLGGGISFSTEGDTESRERTGIGGTATDPQVCPVNGRTCIVGNHTDHGCYIEDASPDTAINGWYRHDGDNLGTYAIGASEFYIGNNNEITREFAEGIQYVTDGPITYVICTMEVKFPHASFVNPNRTTGGTHFFRVRNRCGLASPRNMTYDDFEIHAVWGSADKSGFQIHAQQFDFNPADPAGPNGTPILRYDRFKNAYDSSIHPSYRLNWGINEWLKVKFSVQIFNDPASPLNFKCILEYIGKGVAGSDDPVTPVSEPLVKTWDDGPAFARDPLPIRVSHFGNWDKEPGAPSNLGIRVRNLSIVNPQR